jgi:hypothetical protein
MVHLSDGEWLRQAFVDDRLQELRLVIRAADERQAVAELRYKRMSPLVSIRRGQWAVSHDEVGDDGQRRHNRRSLVGPHTGEINQRPRVGKMQQFMEADMRSAGDCADT